MANPNTRYWKAWEDRQPGPDGPTLHVSGEVEVTNTNQTPVLAEAVPQGINPAILILELSITTSGIGNPVVTWKNVKFTKKVKPGQHTKIDIRSITTIDVEIVQ